MFKFSMVPCWLFLVSSAVADEPTTIELGGPRKAVAVIASSNESYEIEVGLRAVRCFDAPLNQRLSQEKAGWYARAALVRFLGGGSGDSLTIESIESVEVKKSETIEGRFVSVLSVPRRKVRLNKGTASAERVGASTELARKSILQAADDYRETLEIITRDMLEEVPRLDGPIADFYRAVGDAEELGVDRLASLDQEVTTDRWLLTHEREEIRRSIGLARTRFLDLLRKRVEEVESKTDRGE